MAFFPRGPLTLLSLFPARPASRRPSRAPLLLGPAPRQPSLSQATAHALAQLGQATAGPAPRACFPRPATDSPTPPVSASPTSAPRPRNCPAMSRGRNRRSWRRGSAPLVRLGLFLCEAEPLPRGPLSLPAPFSPCSWPQLSHGEAPRPAVRRPRRRLPRATVDSILPRCELRRPPLYLPVAIFSFLLASRALAASSAGHGRRPWRPPR